MSLDSLKDLSEIEVVSTEPLGVWEFKSVDSVFIKQMHMTKTGTIVPQHSHKYEHCSLLGRGSVRLWGDGVLVGDFSAPTCLTIKAHCKHTFMSLEPDTIVYCIHNVSRMDEVEID